MKIYNKRIAFLVSHQTLIPHGGIGQFTKSFVELMTHHNIKVDVICDKQPRQSAFVSEVENAGANISWPLSSLPYTDHSAIFMYGDSFCYERMANFRSALIESLTHNLYDAVVCNTYESVQVAYAMGLSDVTQVIAYTHLESQIFEQTKNPFLAETNSMMRCQLQSHGLTIGTQSDFNAEQLSGLVQTLPIPFTEHGLFTKYMGKREGVLFIGRWEEGKNPELFLKLIEETRLPARVMTNANGAVKFEERLKKIGVEYEIKSSIIGQEKVDFISSCRLAFNPSTVESFGIAFQETMTQLPTVGLSGQRWLNNFNSDYFFVTTAQDMASDITKMYDYYELPQTYYDLGALEYIKSENDLGGQKWIDCINKYVPKVSASNAAKICSVTEVKYADYIADLNRNLICVDDVRSVMTNKSKFTVVYTDDNTYLSKDPKFVPVEEETGSGLFDW